MFYDRYVEACNMCGIARTRVLRELGMSTSRLNYWKSGGEPTHDDVAEIAEFLGVAAEILYDDPSSMTWDKPPEDASSIKNLNESELELLQIFRGKSREDQLKILLYAITLRDADD